MTSILTTCSCGCPLSHEWWTRERDAGRVRIQTCDGEPYDLELVSCPNCGSHRSIPVPSLRRGMMPSVAVMP